MEEKYIPPDIFSYLNPEDVVKITLDGIDKNIRFLDSVFLFIIIISAYLVLFYVTAHNPKIYFSRKNYAGGLSTNDNLELNIFGFKINRKQIFYIAVLTTLIHLTVGIGIRSKTNLIVEIEDNCIAKIDRLRDSLPSNGQPLNHDTTGWYKAVNSELLVKKYVAENYAYQSLSNSIIFQAFNYEKMYLTTKDEKLDATRIFDYLILSIPFLLFTFFFCIIGYEWVNKYNDVSGPHLRFYNKKSFRVTSIVLIYLINIYSLWLWIYGIRGVARLIGFGYGLG